MNFNFKISNVSNFLKFRFLFEIPFFYFFLLKFYIIIFLNVIFNNLFILGKLLFQHGDLILIF